MPYQLQQIHSHRIFTCSDDEWLACLDEARRNGWDEEGTQYDFSYQVDEEYDGGVDYLYNLWMILHLSREMLAWDGNYTEKKNQLISDSDAYYLRQALDETWRPEDRGLLDFLGEGPIRICSE
jgi:hypothetical protein